MFQKIIINFDSIFNAKNYQYEKNYYLIRRIFNDGCMSCFMRQKR